MSRTKARAVTAEVKHERAPRGLHRNPKISEGMKRYWAQRRLNEAANVRVAQSLRARKGESVTAFIGRGDKTLKRKMQARANAVPTSLGVAQFAQLFRELNMARESLSAVERRAVRMFDEWASKEKTHETPSRR